VVVVVRVTTARVQDEAEACRGVAGPSQNLPNATGGKSRKSNRGPGTRRSQRGSPRRGRPEMRASRWAYATTRGRRMPSPRRAEGRGLEPRCGCSRRFSSPCRVLAFRCCPLQFAVRLDREAREFSPSFAPVRRETFPRPSQHPMVLRAGIRAKHLPECFPPAA